MLINNRLWSVYLSLSMYLLCIKGLVQHQKNKMISSFIPPQVISKQYAFLSSAEHKNMLFRRIWIPTQFWFPFTSTVFYVHTMQVNGNWNCLLPTSCSGFKEPLS